MTKHIELFPKGRRFWSKAILVLVFPFATVDAAPTQISATKHFEFFSDPWLNAHHFLYQWARAEENLGEGRLRVRVPERKSLQNLSRSDRDSWNVALEFYRVSVANLSHFEKRMLSQKIALLRLDGDTDAIPEEILPGLVRALRTAMPIYIDNWWAAHDANNRRWVEAIRPELEMHEDRFVALTRRVYNSVWPNEPRRVDISAYANFRAGYTAMGHTVIFASDEGNQGLYGLETLLHEVQHTREVGGLARRQLRESFETAGKEVPANLWHAMIFITAGAFVQSISESSDLPEHQPYWIREGFHEFESWKAVMQAASEHWLPVLNDGELAREGFDRLARCYHDTDCVLMRE